MSELLVVPALIAYGEAAFAYDGELRGPGLAGRLGAGGGRRDAMRGLEARFLAEAAEDPVLVHAEVTGIGPHVARDEAGRVEGRDVAILDGGDVGRADPQLALDIQQRLADRRALSTHHVAKPHFEIIETRRSHPNRQGIARR